MALKSRGMISYFGYGSNMDLTSMRAKGVAPVRSMRAKLRGWRLRFNVEHFFHHEGGMGNIEWTGDLADRAEGVLHVCDDLALVALDRVEAYGIGYDRIEVALETAEGLVQALAYVGLPAFIKDACLPTRRYINILVRGAAAAGVDTAYVAALAAVPVLPSPSRPEWRPPLYDAPVYTRDSLAQQPRVTALAGAVFDMSGCRPRHRTLWSWFGGRDVTLFHLRRLDTSDGTETMADVEAGHLSPSQRQYLTDYLHAFAEEYVYVGRLAAGGDGACDVAAGLPR